MVAAMSRGLSWPESELHIIFVFVSAAKFPRVSYDCDGGGLVGIGATSTVAVVYNPCVGRRGWLPLWRHCVEVRRADGF